MRSYESPASTSTGKRAAEAKTAGNMKRLLLKLIGPFNTIAPMAAPGATGGMRIAGGKSTCCGANTPAAITDFDTVPGLAQAMRGRELNRLALEKTN